MKKSYEIQQFQIDIPRPKMKEGSLVSIIAKYSGTCGDPSDIIPCDSKEAAMALYRSLDNTVKEFRYFYLLEWNQAMEIVINDDDEIVEENALDMPERLCKIDDTWTLLSSDELRKIASVERCSRTIGESEDATLTVRFSDSAGVINYEYNGVYKAWITYNLKEDDIPANYTKVLSGVGTLKIYEDEGLSYESPHRKRYKKIEIYRAGDDATIINYVE